MFVRCIYFQKPAGIGDGSICIVNSECLALLVSESRKMLVALLQYVGFGHEIAYFNLQFGQSGTDNRQIRLSNL